MAVQQNNLSKLCVFYETSSPTKKVTKRKIKSLASIKKFDCETNNKKKLKLSRFFINYVIDKIFETIKKHKTLLNNTLKKLK